jgi:hypothetical protein
MASIKVEINNLMLKNEELKSIIDFASLGEIENTGLSRHKLVKMG